MWGGPVTKDYGQEPRHKPNVVCGLSLLSLLSKRARAGTDGDGRIQKTQISLVEDGAGEMRKEDR